LSRRGSRPRRSPLARALVAVFGLLTLAIAVAVLGPIVKGTLRRLTLPLSDAGIIRAQASADHLDPALVAAVIYSESRFRPRESSAGALGLMQILPETAQFIAQRTGGIEFTTADLATPEVNVAYGSWYLRYLLDHYGGQELPAIAAYNAGLTKVDGWVAHAREVGRTLSDSEIPYPVTREYVSDVLSAQGEYRATYAHQLGLQ
jgi:soluble lytic murein transglycosylase